MLHVKGAKGPLGNDRHALRISLLLILSSVVLLDFISKTQIKKQDYQEFRGVTPQRETQCGALRSFGPYGSAQVMRSDGRSWLWPLTIQNEGCLEPVLDAALGCK